MLGFLYLVALFFVLTPGILVTLPKKGSKYTVAVTHAAIFGAVYYFFGQFLRIREGFYQRTVQNAINMFLSGKNATVPSRQTQAYVPKCTTIPEVKGTCSDGRTKCVYPSQCPPTKFGMAMRSGICHGGQAAYQSCR